MLARARIGLIAGILSSVFIVPQEVGADELAEISFAMFEKACLLDPYDYTHPPLRAPLLKGRALDAETLSLFLPGGHLYAGGWEFGPSEHPIFVLMTVQAADTNIVGECMAVFPPEVDLAAISDVFLRRFEGATPLRDEQDGDRRYVERSFVQGDKTYTARMSYRSGDPKGLALSIGRLVGFLID